jgi:hypothetical protein
MLNRWFFLAADTMRLGLEAQQVIGLRCLKIAAGGAAAQAEMARMISEKSVALAEAATAAATGGSARAVMRGYRTRIRANARRLSRRS